MPRGGKRPGAGVPKDNLNALKHGRYSRRLKQLTESLSLIPEVRDALLAFKRINDRKVRKARQTARKLFSQLLLGLPPQPDQEINQTIQQLIRNFQISGSTNAPQFNQLPKEHNQTYTPLDPGLPERDNGEGVR